MGSGVGYIRYLLDKRSSRVIRNWFRLIEASRTAHVRSHLRPDSWATQMPLPPRLLGVSDQTVCDEASNIAVLLVPSLCHTFFLQP